MTKLNLLQIDLHRHLARLEKVRSKYPFSIYSRRPEHAEGLKKYAEERLPIRNTVKRIRKQIKAEEALVAQVKHIAHTVAELSDLETIWQLGQSRKPEIERAKYLFVILARQQAIPARLVQWYLNKEKKQSCQISRTYKAGMKKVRSLPEYKQSYQRLQFALKKT